MPVYEYKVVPAPARGEKARGVKGPEARFAYALECVMNEMAEGGWEFLRSETLPSEERSGLTQTVTQWRNVLVFRKARADDASLFQPRRLEAPRPAPLPRPVDMSAGTEPEAETDTAEEPAINAALRARAEALRAARKSEEPMAAE